MSFSGDDPQVQFVSRTAYAFMGQQVDIQPQYDFKLHVFYHSIAIGILTYLQDYEGLTLPAPPQPDIDALDPIPGDPFA